MRSLAPKDYESLPRRDPPAGYICVIRDVDDNAYRIDSAHHPLSFVDSVRSEQKRNFGLELIALLETDDLAASAAELYERHQATLDSAWLHLDEYQLTELRRSILQIDAHASHYLKQSQTRGPEAFVPAERVSEGESPGAQHRRGSLQPGLTDLEQVRSRRERRLSYSNQLERAARAPLSLGDRFVDMWVRHPVPFIIGLIIVVIFCLVSLSTSNYSRYGAMQSRGSTGSSGNVAGALPRATGTPKPSYTVPWRALARGCPYSTCDPVGILGAGHELDADAVVRGSTSAGSDQWIGFLYKGRRAYIHSSSLLLIPLEKEEARSTFSRGSTVIVTELASVRSCVWQCKVVGELSSGSEIKVLGLIQGQSIGGNDIWIRLSYNDEAAYIHSRKVKPRE